MHEHSSLTGLLRHTSLNEASMYSRAGFWQLTPVVHPPGQLIFGNLRVQC